MRIAMITDSYRPTMDGVVTALLAQKRALEDLGHAVFIIAPDPGEKDREEGVYYLKAKRFKSYPDYFIPLYRSRVKKIIRELDVDIIQIYGVAFMALKAMLVSHSLKIPTVLTYVTNVTDVMDFYSPLKILPLKTQKKLVWIYLRNLLKRPNRLVLLTPESQRDMEQHNVHARKIEILPMCIDVERFRPGFDGDEIRRRYGLEDKRVVINVGRMSYEKNLPQVIDAMRFMPEDVMLLSVGSGPAFDDVKKHAEEVGLMDRVIFTGFVPNEVLAQYYCAADCVVSASRFETQGLTIVEAMACGIPAACAAGRAFLDIIKDGWNGYLFEDSPKACAEAMLKCLCSGSDLSEGIRATAEEYSIPFIGKRIEAMYFALLEEKGRIPSE